MNNLIPITELRKNLFNLTRLVYEKGEVIEVEKEGKRIVRIVKIEDNPKEKAGRMIKILPKIAGIWKDYPESERKDLKEFIRGKKEKGYMKNLDKDI